LTAAAGLGTALGPVIGRRLAGPEPRRMIWVVPTSYLWSGLFYLALAKSWSLASVGAAMFLMRMGGSTLWVFSTVLLQMASEDRMRGRVFAAEQSLVTLTMALSGVVVGAAIDRGTSAFTVARALGLISLLAGLAWSYGLAARLRGDEAARKGTDAAA